MLQAEQKRNPDDAGYREESHSDTDPVEAAKRSVPACVSHDQTIDEDQQHTGQCEEEVCSDNGFRREMHDPGNVRTLRHEHPGAGDDNVAEEDDRAGDVEEQVPSIRKWRQGHNYRRDGEEAIGCPFISVNECHKSPPAAMSNPMLGYYDLRSIRSVVHCKPRAIVWATLPNETIKAAKISVTLSDEAAGRQK